MQVDVDDEGGEADQGLMWCCCEPSAGSKAKPLPDIWLLVWLWVQDIGQPVLPRRLLEAGSGQLWGRRGLSEVWQDLSSLFLNGLTAAVDKLKDNDAQQSLRGPFSDPVQSEDEVEPLRRGCHVQCT